MVVDDPKYVKVLVLPENDGRFDIAEEDLELKECPVGFKTSGKYEKTNLTPSIHHYQIQRNKRSKENQSHTHTHTLSLSLPDSSTKVSHSNSIDSNQISSNSLRL
ncbi:hypothetical protein RIF29_30214 [Crotalaria pallida]|uniref:Uncharacterized protein n=1 Tax=Crotalaria pallida TaxID=3830 RepID=A0AAN9EIA5_CROPI